MSSKNNLPAPGAEESNEGDLFHVLWAARRAVQLLNPRSGLHRVVMEGLPPTDAEDNDNSFLGVDLSEYYGGNELKTAEQVEVSQLKYSTRHPTQAWTTSRLCTAKNARGTNSIIRRLADIYKGFLQNNSRAEILQKLSISLVSIQPAATELLFTLTTSQNLLSTRFTSESVQIEQLLNLLSEEAQLVIKPLYAKSGLTNTEFTDFIRILDLSHCGEESWEFQHIRLIQEISPSFNHDPVTTLKSLCDLIAKQALPGRGRFGLSIEDILANLGAGHRDNLFPAQPRLDTARRPVITLDVQNLADTIVSASSRKVLAHGMAGIGKTTTVQSLVDRLPPHSVVVIYDCYGGGSYKDFGAQRHTPQRAFLQLSNELAVRCGSPFLVQSAQNIPDLQRHFTRSVEMAAKIVAEQGGLLVIAIDAADNAITAAIENGDEKSCFVPDLWTIALPENCRLLMTARSHRCESLQPTRDVEQYLLQGFDRQASIDYLKYSFPDADEHSGEVFHEKTSGNPRVQFYLLDRIDVENINSTTLERLLEVSQRTPNQIFEDLFNAAIPKVGNREINRKKLATLVYLNRPVPMHIFAGTCEIDLDEARRFCQALEPGIILGDDYFSFRDEDFETYLRDEIKGNEIISVHHRLGTYFLDSADRDEYSARVVAEHLFLAERYQDVIQLTIDSAELPITDELLRSQIRHSRIVLAMQSACKSNMNAEAVRLVLLAAEAKRSNNAFKALVRKNPELAARYGDTANIAYFHQQENDTWMGSIHFRTAAMYARDPAYRDRAEEQLKLANAWIRRWMALPKAERHQWKLDNIDIACGAEAIFWLKGAQECQHWLSKWRPIDTVIKATELLVKSLVRQIDATHKEQLFTELRLPIWAKALFLSTVGAINPNLSNTFVEQLDRTLASLDEIIQQGQQDKHLQTEWAIDLCELAVRYGLDNRRTLRLLEAVSPQLLNYIPDIHIDLPKWDLPLRSVYLKAALSGTTVSKQDLIPERYRQKEGDNNDLHYSERRRFDETIGKLLNVYLVRAQTIFRSHNVADIAQSLSDDLNLRLQQTTYRSFEPDFYYHAWAITACEALLNCVDDASSMLIEIADASARIMPGASPKLWIDLVRRFLCDERYRSIGFDLLERAANYIMDNPNPGQERWETLLTCSEIVSPYDAVQGRDYYKRSLAAADRIDDDSIHLLSFQADLACQVAETLTIEQRQDYSVRLAATVVAFKEYVSDDSELPWEKTIAAVTRLAPANGIALCSQWDDENHLALDDGIIPVVRETVRSQFIKPLEGLALLRLAGKHYDISELAIDLLDRQRLEGVNARPQLVQLLQEISLWIRRDLPIKYRQQAATRILDWGKTHRLEQFAGMAELRDLLSLVTSIPVKEESDRMPSYFDESKRNSLKQAELDRTNTVAQARSSIVALVRNGSFDLLPTQLFIISRNSYGKEIPEILSIAGASITPSQRIDFLNALVSIELDFSLIISVVEFLKVHLEKWKNSVPIKAWMPMGMAKLLENNLPRFLVPLSYSLDISLDDVLSFANFPQGNRTELVLSALGKHLDVLSAQELYRVAKCIAPAIPGINLSATFEWSLHRTEAQIEREQRTLILPVFIASSGSSVTLANFFWALFGHPDKCIRWQALHAAREIAKQPDRLLIDELMRLSTTRSATGFRSERLEFYWMSARTWLMLLLQRLADECPQLLESHAQKIAVYALDREFPHAQIRELAKRTALRLVERIPGCLSSEIIEQLYFANTPLSCLYPKDRTEHSHPLRTVQQIRSESRFQFDSTDTIPYWYEPASDVFGYIRPDVTDRSEQWICDRWGRTDRDCYDDIRDLSKRYDWQSKSNNHGAVPRIENLKTYLEYHAMFCAVGEMLDRKISIDGDTYSGIDCPLQDWLGEHLNSSNDYWISDLRSPTPHRLDCWGEFSSIDIKQWLQYKEPAEFDSGLGLIEEAHAGEITVLGDISIRDSLRNSNLSVRSSLVNPSGARSLLNALQATDSRKFQLPVANRGASKFEIDESGFKLTAFMREVRSWDEILDTFDPLSRERGFRLEDFQPHFIETMKLQPNSNRTEYLSDNDIIAAKLEIWSDGLDEQYISHPYSSGERWWVRLDILLEYLRQCNRDLIIEVQIKRNRNERNQTEVGEDYQYDSGNSRIYILRQNGILETLDSHRDIRTAAS